MLIAADRVAETARALAEVLHLDRRELEKKLQARRYFTWVKRRISPEEARAVRELALPGVYLDREPRRYYPNRALAGPLLGWAGLDGVGQEGIELQYERYLRGARAQLAGPARRARPRGAHRRHRRRRARAPRAAHDVCTRPSIATSSSGSSARSRRAWPRTAPRPAWRWRSIRTTARCWRWRRCRRSTPTSPTARASAARATAR